MPAKRERADLTDPFKDVAEELAARRTGPRRFAVAPTFVLFMLALTVLFAALGAWQLARLDEKETMIARIAERAVQPPRSLPPLSEWVGFDPEVWDFRPVALRGTFRHDQTILVFTSLMSPRGSFSGPGYWVVAPLELEQGGVVFVNRGFIPGDLKASFAEGGAAPRGPVNVSGIARTSEAINNFTPGADPVARIEWVRNIERLTALVDPALGPIAPIYVDQSEGVPGALPQAGETLMTFTNRHLEYALTWLSLAILTPLMVGVWLLRRGRS